MLLVGRSHTESIPLRPLWPAVSPGQPLVQGRVKLAQATPVLPFDQHEGSGIFLESITKHHQIIRKSLLRAFGMGASAESPSSGFLRNAVWLLPESSLDSVLRSVQPLAVRRMPTWDWLPMSVPPEGPGKDDAE